MLAHEKGKGRRGRLISMILVAVMLCNNMPITGLAQGKEKVKSRWVVTDFQELPEEMYNRKVVRGTGAEEMKASLPDTLEALAVKEDMEEDVPENPTSDAPEADTSLPGILGGGVKTIRQEVAK